MTTRIRTKTPVDFSGLSFSSYWIALLNAEMSSMIEHVCGVDCWTYFKVPGDPTSANGHMMYGLEPSTAAGRYQWEQNLKITTRRAWDATGQVQSRECRAWDRARAELILSGTYHPYGEIGSRRAMRHARQMFGQVTGQERDSEGDLITDPEDLWGAPEGAYE